MDPFALDHVIVAGPSLPDLVAALEARTGVRAVAGGRHAGQGTHNALAGLGDERYLELLVPDPDGSGGRFRDEIRHLGRPALHGWCARAGDADAVAERVRSLGLSARRLPMTRTRPDGVALAWELVYVDGHPYGGLMPFFIDWRGSPHPSASLGGPLAFGGLELAHPDAAGLAALLGAWGPLPEGVRVVEGGAPRLAAAWRGPAGEDAWSGRGGPI
ncbi:MAG: VOC family protein [Trueperaceae bacterium]|nr:VOC family protein [Trueperaceae bacterium]